MSHLQFGLAMCVFGKIVRDIFHALTCGVVTDEVPSTTCGDVVSLGPGQPIA